MSTSQSLFTLYKVYRFGTKCKRRSTQKAANVNSPKASNRQSSSTQVSISGLTCTCCSVLPVIKADFTRVTIHTVTRGVYDVTIDSFSSKPDGSHVRLLILTMWLFVCVCVCVVGGGGGGGASKKNLPTSQQKEKHSNIMTLPF